LARLTPYCLNKLVLDVIHYTLPPEPNQPSSRVKKRWKSISRQPQKALTKDITMGNWRFRAGNLCWACYSISGAVYYTFLQTQGKCERAPTIASVSPILQPKDQVVVNCEKSQLQAIKNSQFIENAGQMVLNGLAAQP